MKAENGRSRSSIIRLSMREVSISCGWLAGFLMGLYLILGLIQKGPLTAYQIFLFSLFGGPVLMLLLWLFLFLIGPLPGLLRLRREERLLGIKYKEDGPDTMPDPRWFVFCERCRVLIFYQGYLSSAGCLRKLPSRFLPRAEMLVTDCTGRAFRIVGGSLELKRLQKWICWSLPQSQ